ncbi:unnamed protein product [Rotaria socialis]
MSGLMLRLVIKLYLTNYIGFGIGFIHLEAPRTDVGSNTSLFTVGMIIDYNIFPSPQITESIVEPYNAMLAAQHQSDSTENLFFAPLISRRDQSYRAISIRELVDQVFNPRNVMCALDLRQGQNVTVALIFLGCLSMYQVDEHNAACTKS